jgi:regulatory protein
MPVITAIEKQPRRPRANIALDGEYAFSLRLDVITLAGLQVGQGLLPEQRQEMEAEDQRLGAIEAALKLLAAGPRTQRDLRERLRRRGFGQEAADHALQRMRELGYLNDAAFARFYVEARRPSPRSNRALAFELSRKGIDKQLVTSALEGHSDADAAYEAAQRRLRNLTGLDRQTFERKLGSFLSGRGFAYSITRATVARCWQELHGEPHDEEDV